MKVTAFNGSPHRDGNTYTAMETVLEVLQKEGIQTEIIQVGGQIINPCKVCLRCRQIKDGYCHGYGDETKDILNSCLKKMYESDGIIIASPVYFGSITPEIKALIDRAGYASRGNESKPLKRKVCSGIAVARRQGAGTTLEQINNFFALSEVIVPYSSYWNMAIGLKPGDVLNDKEGIATLRTLGENMAWLIKKLYG